jgi:hypothetical protein
MRWPSRNYFAELQPRANESHPIDRLLDASPQIRRTARRARRALERIQRRADANDVLEFEEERNAAEWARVETAYNLGVEGGLVLGRADGLRERHGRPRRSDGERVLLAELRGALAATQATPEEVEALLLELAYAHAVEPGKISAARRRRG